tara:strand:+ start:422 stop:763 length:342 start_codon:yes stop_codon:yes gene_type:complete
MNDDDLPKVGDIITFSNKYNLLKDNDEDVSVPYGIVTKVVRYRDVDIKINNTIADPDLFNTLAYPFTFDADYFGNSDIFFVKWASTDKKFSGLYRCINEEWFYQGMFIVVSRA